MRLKIDDISQLNGQHFFIQCDLRMCISVLMASESMKYILLKIQIILHHSSAENPSMASI